MLTLSQVWLNQPNTQVNVGGMTDIYLRPRGPTPRRAYSVRWFDAPSVVKVTPPGPRPGTRHFGRIPSPLADYKAGAVRPHHPRGATDNETRIVLAGSTASHPSSVSRCFTVRPYHVGV